MQVRQDYFLTTIWGKHSLTPLNTETLMGDATPIMTWISRIELLNTSRKLQNNPMQSYDRKAAHFKPVTR